MCYPENKRDVKVYLEATLPSGNQVLLKSRPKGFSVTDRAIKKLRQEKEPKISTFEKVGMPVSYHTKVKQVRASMMMHACKHAQRSRELEVLNEMAYDPYNPYRVKYSLNKVKKNLNKVKKNPDWVN